MNKRILNTYFQCVYNKLEADALLFNRRLPHEGLKGSENEHALAGVIRDFLPSRYGVEVNALVIDRYGNVSRQCDIVIFDNVQFPKYFKKVYPVEMVFAVIEVKTELNKQQADRAFENEIALRKLCFQPLLTPYWENKTKEDSISHSPPVYCVFGYRSNSDDFGTFLKWFSMFPTESEYNSIFAYNQSLNGFVVCALDKGIIFCRGDGHVARWLAVAEGDINERRFEAVGSGYNFNVDPAKSLFVFLETLWSMLEQMPRHPGFDIRSYIDAELGAFVPFSFEGKVIGAE